MKRSLLLSVLFLMAWTGLRAQVEPQSEYRGSHAYWGFQDRTGKWVVKPELDEVQRARDGFFYAKYDNKWGVYNSRAEMIIPIAYDNVTLLDPDLKMAAVKVDGKWGIVDFAGHVIVNYEYMSIKSVPSGTSIAWWEENASGGGQEKYRVYPNPEMMAHRDKILAQYAEKEAKEAQQKQAAEERNRKEAELASFTTYAKAYVEPRIDSWQRKDEFETTDEYKQRVTGTSRAAKINALSEEARTLFLQEHAKLQAGQRLSLGTYDADNGVYKLTSPVFGDLLLAVPRSEAPAFKQEFSNYTMVDQRYYVNNDRIGLLEFKMRSPQGKSYAYSNQQALTYNTYEVDLGKYDFAPIEIAPVTSASGQSTYETVRVQTSPGAVAAAKPTLKILSPATGSSYDGREVVIRYEATTGDGTAPTIEVWINGKPYPLPAAQQAKGVKRVGEELPLELPQEPGECYVIMQVSDEHGGVQMEQLVLTFTGDKPKPALNLLAVGVSDYDQADLKLFQAAKDARDFAGVISQSDLSSYSRLNTPAVLTDKAATEKGIVQALRQLDVNTNPGDVVMLFFSGHGEKEGNETYFLSVDADKKDLFSTAVDFDIINKAVQRLVAKQCKVVVFMDACYSGSMGSKGVGDDISLSNPGVVGFYSSTRDQQSKEPADGSNGVFTKALLSGLQGKAANAEGEISVYRLQTYISDEVKRETGGKQQPIIENKQGDIVLFRIK